MIEPTKITDYNRTPRDLFEFAVFCVCVAGKNADQTARKVDALCNDPEFRTYMVIQWELFGTVSDTLRRKHIDNIRLCLVRHKVGQYNRIAPAIYELNQCYNLLPNITFGELLNIAGIGPKTAAFFLLHSRETANIPVIDTHIVKYMQGKGVDIKVTSDPTQYLINATKVNRAIQQDYPTMTLAAADQLIWNTISGRV